MRNPVCVRARGVNPAAAHPEPLRVSYVKMAPVRGSVLYIMFRQIEPRSRRKYGIVQLRKEDYVGQGRINPSLVGETMAPIVDYFPIVQVIPRGKIMKLQNRRAQHFQNETPL